MMTALAVLCMLVVGQSDLTPGTAALLVGREDADYRADLQRAIASPDPVVRAVAARVAGVRHQQDVADALRAALASETDPLAKREEQRAISSLERGAASPDPSTPFPAAQTVRTFLPVAPGVLSSLMTAAGCKPGSLGQAGAAWIAFDASGTALRSELDTHGLPSKCRDVLSTMARLAVSGNPREAHSEYLLLPMDADFVRCTDEPATDGTGGRPRPGLIPPRQIRDVRANYPPSAIRRRENGMVWLVIHVTRSGCVNEVRVTRGLTPAFDMAAIRAASLWAFEPAYFENAPIPFFVTASLSFQIR